MKKTYAGLISNKGGQEVKPLFEAGKNKAPKVKVGGDLRVKKADK